MPGEKIKQSKFMQRCVADVTGQGKDTSGAFAICTAQQQKAGYAEPGSRKLTGKGKKREKAFASKKDMPEKRKAYLAATGRAEEAMGRGGVSASVQVSAPMMTYSQDGDRINYITWGHVMPYFGAVPAKDAIHVLMRGRTTDAVEDLVQRQQISYGKGLSLVHFDGKEGEYPYTKGRYTGATVKEIEKVERSGGHTVHLSNGKEQSVTEQATGLKSILQRIEEAMERQGKRVVISTEKLRIVAQPAGFQVSELVGGKNQFDDGKGRRIRSIKVGESVAANKQFMRWVEANDDAIEGMNYKQVYDALREQGIKFQAE